MMCYFIYILKTFGQACLHIVNLSAPQGGL